MQPWLAGVLAAIQFAIASAWATPPERVLPMDPVDLIAGRESPGKPELAIVREGVEYRFATAANKAAFEKDPAKYEVADGGACGRMGPLSGLGDARRFCVHKGRIYFFASDGCRAGFLKEPDSYIEADDDMPFGSNEQVLRGRAILDRVVAWAGGADKLKAMTSIRATAERTERQGDKDWNVRNETVIAFPDRYFQSESWNESWYSTTATSEGGAMASSRGEERIADSRTRGFRRVMARWPIVLIKAHVDGSPKADCPGLVVIADGEGEFEGVSVEYVKVWLNGAASRLTVEKETGRPRQLSFRGRDGSMRVGDSVRTFTKARTVDGVTLPTAYTVVFNGKDLAPAAGVIDRIEINPGSHGAKFSLPEW